MFFQFGGSSFSGAFLLFRIFESVLLRDYGGIMLETGRDDRFLANTH